MSIAAKCVCSFIPYCNGKGEGCPNKLEVKPTKAKPVFYSVCFQPLKELAAGLGYNLLMNGSLNRDMDLVAIPWSDEPVPEVQLITTMDMFLRGIKYAPGSEETGYMHNTLPGGRSSWIINLNRGGDFNNYLDEQWYLDISITPLKVQL